MTPNAEYPKIAVPRPLPHLRHLRLLAFLGCRQSEILVRRLLAPLSNTPSATLQTQVPA